MEQGQGVHPEGAGGDVALFRPHNPVDGTGQGLVRSTWGCGDRCVQSFRRRRHLGHRRGILPGGPKTRLDGTGFLDQPIDPGKGRIAGPTSEGRTRPQARGVKNSRSPQVDWTP